MEADFLTQREFKDSLEFICSKEWNFTDFKTLFFKTNKKGGLIKDLIRIL